MNDNLNYAHQAKAEEHIKNKNYARAVFHYLQLPTCIAQKGLENIKKAVANNHQYKELGHIIDEVREYSLHHEHMQSAKRFIREERYPQAFFHYLQLPAEIAGKSLQSLGKRISSTHQYQELSHTIEDILKREKKN